MAEAHDSWLAGLGVDVRAYLTEVAESVGATVASLKGVAETAVFGPDEGEAIDGKVADGPPAETPAAPTVALKGTVGRGGKNDPADVSAIQQALNYRAQAGLGVTGECDDATIKAIEAFQRANGSTKPDGRVDPGQGTERALNGITAGSSADGTPPKESPTPTAPTDAAGNPTNRPDKPSSAAAQMAALLSTAMSRAGSSAPHGKCYAEVKKHILAAGGYGDILDIYKDERFTGYQMSAVNFADAVNAVGAAELGLEEVSGSDPLSAAPGTILVLKGNGVMKMSVTHGDISVIGKIEKGCLVCYNDGKMLLSAKKEIWGSGGDYEGTMVAMYRPISRS